MSLVIDADGHVEENLAELVGAIPAAMRPHAMHFVSVAGGHVTYEIEGRLWRSKWRCRQAWHIAAAGGGTPMNRDAARNYGDFRNTHQFTGLFESKARRELRRDPTILD
jgi:L-fuculose-phosphate aldolase